MNGVYRDSDGFLLRAGDSTFIAGAGETLRSDVPVPFNTISNLNQEGKANKWDGDVWVVETPPVIPAQNVLCWAEGEYTGDGSTGLDISGIPFTGVYLKVVLRDIVSGNAIDVWETWGAVLDDDAAGMCIVHRSGASPPHAVLKDALLSMGVGKFRVSDQGANLHPNKTGVKYNWYIMGF